MDILTEFYQANHQKWLLLDKDVKEKLDKVGWVPLHRLNAMHQNRPWQFTSPRSLYESSLDSPEDVAYVNAYNERGRVKEKTALFEYIMFITWHLQNADKKPKEAECVITIEYLVDLVWELVYIDGFPCNHPDFQRDIGTPMEESEKTHQSDEELVNNITEILLDTPVDAEQYMDAWNSQLFKYPRL